VSVCHQSFTLTQDISWGLLLCSTFPTQGTVAQSHNVKVSSEVLCPIRRSITTLDCVLLKDSSLVLAAIRGPELNSRACLWVPASPCHSVTCCLSNQHWIFFFILGLETPRTGSGPTKWWTEPSLASSSEISFPKEETKRIAHTQGLNYPPVCKYVVHLHFDSNFVTYHVFKLLNIIIYS
jgi:hypothetical protein